MNDLWEEFQERRVGVFGVCGQPKGEVDLMVSENNLRFKVSIRKSDPITFFIVAEKLVC